jgi:hypothetical protein
MVEWLHRAGDYLAHHAAYAKELDGAVKDAALIVEAIEGVDLDPAPMGAVHTHLSRAASAGHGGKDMSATYLEHRARS